MQAIKTGIHLPKSSCHNESELSKRDSFLDLGGTDFMVGAPSYIIQNRAHVGGGIEFNTGGDYNFPLEEQSECPVRHRSFQQ